MGKRVSKKLDKGKGRGTATDMEGKKGRTKFPSEVTETVYLTRLMFKDIQQYCNTDVCSHTYFSFSFLSLQYFLKLYH